MAENIDNSGALGLRSLASEDLSAKNLLSHVNSIRLKVIYSSFVKLFILMSCIFPFSCLDSPKLNQQDWRLLVWKDT